MNFQTAPSLFTFWGQYWVCYSTGVTDWVGVHVNILPFEEWLKILPKTSLAVWHRAIKSMQIHLAIEIHNKKLHKLACFHLSTLGICNAYFNIGHIVGMFYNWPDCFYSWGLRANWNVSGKLSMKLAIVIPLPTGSGQKFTFAFLTLVMYIVLLTCWVTFKTTSRIIIVTIIIRVNFYCWFILLFLFLLITGVLIIRDCHWLLFTCVTLYRSKEQSKF